MSKSLRSMSVEKRREAIIRRISENRGGLGYWAAVDAAKKQAVKHE